MMYTYNDIQSVHIEITSKCQARCPMCPRRLQGGPILPWMKLTEITIDQFKQWFEVKFIKQLTSINFCGNLGDPINAQDIIPIIEYLRMSNNNLCIQMHTNGSARSESFWKELARLNVHVIFGIDGLADTHVKYRINTNWDKIIANAKIFINAGGRARWDMLLFAHNEHQVSACEELAKKLGFDDFKSKNSSRFRDDNLHVLNDKGQTVDILYPTLKSKKFKDKINDAVNEHIPTITCKAQKQNEIYVAASGNIVPCCWIDLEWVPPMSTSRIDYMNKIGFFPNLKDHSLTSILESDYFTSIESLWNTPSCLNECKKQCGSFDKLGEQFES